MSALSYGLYFIQYYQSSYHLSQNKYSGYSWKKHSRSNLKTNEIVQGEIFTEFVLGDEVNGDPWGIAKLLSNRNKRYIIRILYFISYEN